ncbi:unknown [Ruminococcus sp. CAG:579]|nr:unknown [Ruminococcus sp. CAG:579]
MMYTASTSPPASAFSTASGAAPHSQSCAEPLSGNIHFTSMSSSTQALMNARWQLRGAATVIRLPKCRAAMPSAAFMQRLLPSADQQVVRAPNISAVRRSPCAITPSLSKSESAPFISVRSSGSRPCILQPLCPGICSREMPEAA